MRTVRGWGGEGGYVVVVVGVVGDVVVVRIVSDISVEVWLS